ncbi:MAG TPA: sugar ABC transporter permease, partial [Trueperaceae bacterium]|nr:sugar ABC transporter permease [Trueperaceae bacterium]
MSIPSELRSLVRSGRGEKGGKAARRDNRVAYLFLAPWLVGLLFITIGPMIASLYLSFTDYNLLTSPSWIGFDNYREMLGDARLWRSFKVTVKYVAFSVPPLLAFALLIALLLNRGMRGLAFYRSVLYLPSMLGGSVAVAILWRQVFGASGIVNQLLAEFGIQGQGWISNPKYALWTIIILNIWTFGSPMIIFLAGLRQVPEMYYDSAKVDGASPLRQFFSITLPLLTPIIFFNLVLQVIFAFQAFTQAFIVSGGTGGPADS